MENIFNTMANQRLKENTKSEESSKKIVSKISNIPTGFAALDNHVETGIKFDDKKIEVYRQGKTINIQDWINKGNKDVTIYQVLEEYHGDLKLTQEALNHNATRLSDAFANIKSLKDVYDIQKAGEKEWENLPLSIRREFGNDVKRFMNEGEKWANKKIADYQAELAKKDKKENEEKGEVNNG